MTAAAATEYQAALLRVCQISRLRYDDPFVWREIVSNDLLLRPLPLAFLWENRHRPLSWSALAASMGHTRSQFFEQFHARKWSYSEMLAELDLWERAHHAAAMRSSTVFLR